MVILVGTLIGKSLAVSAIGTAAAATTAGAQLISAAGFLGSMIGAYVDATILRKMTTSSDAAKSDKFPDKIVTTRDEGAPTSRIFGREVRIAGHIIWEQWPRTQKKHANKSGKGVGGGAGHITYTYRQSFAVEWNKCFGTPNTSFEQIFANGDVVWDITPDIDFTSDQLSLIGGGVSIYQVGPNPTNPTEETYYAYVESPIAGPNLGAFKDEKYFKTEGWTTSAMNNDFADPDDLGWLVTETELKTNGKSWLRCIVGTGTNGTPSHPISGNETAGADIHCFQSQPTHSGANFAELTHYIGSLTQTQDDTIIFYENNEDVPAYRDRSYTVFKSWRLEQYGNLIPQTIEALIVVDPEETLATCINKLLAVRGIDETMRDTSALTKMVLQGYFIIGAKSGIEELAPLMIAYDLVMVDQSGVLTFYKRAELPVTVVTSDKLVAHTSGEDPPRDSWHSPTPRRKLGASVQVSYFDADRDYQTASTNYAIQANGGATKTISIDLPLILSSQEAQIIARRLAWTARANAHAIDDIRLPPSFIGLKAGTLLTAPLEGRTWNILLESVANGANGVIRCRGKVEQQQTLTHPNVLADLLPVVS